MALFTNAPTPDYAFTSISTYHFPAEKAIEDPSTPEGAAWAASLKALIEFPDTGLIWWGRDLLSRERVKLVVDWKTPTGYQNFQSHPDFSALNALISPHLSAPDGEAQSSTTCFLFSSWTPARENAFSRRPSSISAIFTFRFSAASTLEAKDASPSHSAADANAQNLTKKQHFTNAWQRFSAGALRTEGGCISSADLTGWSLLSSQTPGFAAAKATDDDQSASFCGILRWTSMTSMRAYVNLLDTNRDAAWTEMSALADRGVMLEFVDMYCFKEGWLGSVTRTEMDEEGQVGKSGGLFGGVFKLGEGGGE